ncbi:MAG: hypothetical protein B6U68_02060 [Candidatus Aenigmarchaeota archaeon ex4484_14]|nr:MAG: hypothetical protein B6U68_02060 [Candidatus Aenigmarchaeota archaeon ex4484_14]
MDKLREHVGKLPKYVGKGFGKLPEYAGRIGNGFEKLGKIPQTKIREYLGKISEKANVDLNVYDFSIISTRILDLFDQLTGGPYEGGGREVLEDFKNVSKFFSKFA